MLKETAIASQTSLESHAAFIVTQILVGSMAHVPLMAHAIVMPTTMEIRVRPSAPQKTRAAGKEAAIAMVGATV